MKYTIIALTFLVILFKLLFYFNLQGKHEPLYYMKLQGLREAGQYLLFAIFLIVLNYKEKRTCYRIITLFAITFCICSILIPLYPFAPLFIIRNITIITNVFYDIWSFIFICLVLFYLICLKFKVV